MPLDDHTTLVLRELAHELDNLSRVVGRLSGLPEADREYLTSDEVAARLKVHPQTVDKMVRRGLPCYRIGKGPKFAWTEVQSFLVAHHRDSTQSEQWSGATRARRVA